MYGNIKEKKLTDKDMRLDCSNIKAEFQNEIDIEHRRINIDSSKKKAVLFRMDYEGFRQMVLGANLYNIKSNELKDFNVKNDKVLNSQLNNYRPTEEELNLIKLQIKEIQCKNFRDFKAQFDRFYKKQIDEDIYIQLLKYIIFQISLLQAQNKENIKAIFSLDFQIEYFFKMMDILQWGMHQIDEFAFVIGLLDELQKVPDFMQQIKKFLRKSEKERLRDFFEYLSIEICKNDQFTGGEVLNQIKLNYI